MSPRFVLLAAEILLFSVVIKHCVYGLAHFSVLDRFKNQSILCEFRYWVPGRPHFWKCLVRKIVWEICAMGGVLKMLPVEIELTGVDAYIVEVYMDK